MKKISVFFLLLVLLTIGCDNVTDITMPSGLPGIVVNAQTGSSIEGATVSIAGQSSVTPENGRFFFFDVPRGNQVITVTKTGYATYQEPINVTNSTDLRIRLVPQS